MFDPSNLRLTPGNWLLCLAIFNIVAISLVLFFVYVNPSLRGTSNLRIGADSDYYLWHAGLRDDVMAGYDPSGVSLISLNGGVLGPELFARVLRNNFLILCANYMLFFTAVWIFARTVQIKAPLFALLLLLNPSILVSLLTVNKEILVLLSVAMLCNYLASKTRSRTYLTAILLVAFLGRWQNLLVFIIFLTMLKLSNALLRRRGLVLLLLVALITIFYPFIASDVDLMMCGYQNQSNTISILSAVQAHFLFFVVALPKVALNLFGDGLLLLWRGLKDADSTDIYAKFIIPFSSLANIVITIWFLVKRRFSFKEDRLFFVALYALLYSIPPFVSCRYFFPVYVILCLELAIDRKREISHINGNISARLRVTQLSR